MVKLLKNNRKNGVFMNSCKKIVTFAIVGLLSFSAIKASADVDRE